MAETRFTHPEKSSLPAYSFPRSSAKKQATQIPGPGEYSTDVAAELKPKTKAGLVFGRSPKETKVKGLSPGPGAYSTPNLHHAKGGVVGRSSSSSGDKLLSPGPGIYDPDKK
jgi:hypothetical protein